MYFFNRLFSLYTFLIVMVILFQHLVENSSLIYIFHSTLWFGRIFVFAKRISLVQNPSLFDYTCCLRMLVQLSATWPTGSSMQHRILSSHLGSQLTWPICLASSQVKGVVCVIITHLVMILRTGPRWSVRYVNKKV